MESKTDKILAAAFRLIHQHGFKKVTMSDIAEAAELSRPTLYAEFANKEAVISAICAQHVARADAEVAARLPRAKSLKAQLALVFDIWIIVPFASVADSPSGLDLLGNIASYAPAATTALYAQFERHLTALLEPAMPGKRRHSSHPHARDQGPQGVDLDGRRAAPDDRRTDRHGRGDGELRLRDAGRLPARGR